MSVTAHLLARLPGWLRPILETARFSQSVLLAAFGLILANPLWRALVGEAGYTAALVLLSVAGTGAAMARSTAIDWTNALPLSIACYLVWAVSSVFWSYMPLDTLWRLTNLLSTALIGLCIAWTRDTIQIVRGLGDVLRTLLGLSLGIELAVALLGVSWPHAFITGSLFHGGPIQGVFGSRSALAFLALVALFTFIIELRTRSVRRSIGWSSLAGAALCLVLASSPVGFVALGVVALAGFGVFVLRRSAPRVRWRWNTAFVLLGVAALILFWFARTAIIVLLDGRGETTLRVHVWQQLSRYLFARPLNGWGYSGGWWVGGPYSWVQEATNKTLGSALNGYIDVYVQLGAIGLVLFLALTGTALVRSWMLASNRRSVIYVWPALMLVTLVVVSLADSFVLSGAGLLLLVVASVKSARELTWGEAWRTRNATPLPSRAGR